MRHRAAAGKIAKQVAAASLGHRDCDVIGRVDYVEILCRGAPASRSLQTPASGIKMIAKGVASTDHPVMAHIIPIRRCNLSCEYCNEYDDVSKPVPLEVMKARIDHLARLGTTDRHPQRRRTAAASSTRRPDRPHAEHPIIAGMITNGYLLTADRIKRLNRAGLDHLQISIDNVMPDEVSKKSLKVLDKKLQLLAEHAEFHVNINSVVGGGIHNPHDALVVGRRAVQLGFTSTIGIIHDGEGQLSRSATKSAKCSSR